MWKLLTFISLTIIWSTNGFAESYTCSTDLKRFGRAGEIETKTYIRSKSLFKNNYDWTFKIHYENDQQIHLVKFNLDDFTDHMFIVIIDKKTNEFTEKFMSIDDSRDVDEVPQIYGKCIKS